MWLNDIKPKGGMLDGLRAGRRKLDGSDPLKFKNVHGRRSAVVVRLFLLKDVD